MNGQKRQAIGGLSVAEEVGNAAEEVDETYKLILQIVNVLSFCLVFGTRVYLERNHRILHIRLV